MIGLYYKIGLVRTNYTNYLLTNMQPVYAPISLKRVSAASQKEETNVFPNGHPL
jgi:hypothetical protein